MGIQAVVVFIGVVLALAVGIFAGTWYVNSALVGWLAIGLVPVMWGLMHLVERLIGRGIWNYTAPYPYSSMKGAAAANNAGTPVQDAAPRSDAEVPELVRLAA
jgi:hypothetical protein